MVDLEEQIFLAHHMSQFTDNPVQAEFWHALEEGIRGGKYGDRWQDKVSQFSGVMFVLSTLIS